MVAIVGITIAVAEKITLNFLITGVIFREIALSYSGTTVRTLLIMTVLTGKTGAVDNYMPIPLALIAFNDGANLKNFLFRTSVSIIYVDVLVLNICLEWGWKGTRPMRLGMWGMSRHWGSLISSGLAITRGTWLH